MRDACLPWNVYSGRRLLPDVCGWGVSRIASANVCSGEGGGVNVPNRDCSLNFLFSNFWG